jgi:hypothetical protein
MAELERVQAPQRRLNDAVVALGQVEASLAASREEDAHGLAEWIASAGDGARPGVSPTTLALELRLIDACRDGAAARQVLPTVERPH